MSSRSETRLRLNVMSVLAFVANVVIVCHYRTDPRAFVEAFLMTGLVRLMLLETILRVHRRSRSARVQAFLRAITRNPADGGFHGHHFRDGRSGFWRHFGYLASMGAIVYGMAYAAGLVLVFASGNHPDSQADLHLHIAALPVAAVFLANTLVGRRIYVRFGAENDENYGYNSAHILTLVLMAPALCPGMFLGGGLHALTPLLAPALVSLPMLAVVHWMEWLQRTEGKEFGKWKGSGLSLGDF